MSGIFENKTAAGGIGSRIDWAELVVFVSAADARSKEHLDMEKINRWNKQFAAVTIAGRGERPDGLAGEVSWHSYGPKDTRSEIYNRFLDVAGKKWVLFLEEDEELHIDTFPQREEISPHRWAPACIKTRKGKNPRQYYQMRLVPAGKGPLFDGHEIADCTRFIQHNEIQIADAPIIVKRKSELFHHVEVEEELSLRNYSPQLYLVQGEQYYQEGKFVHAAAQYRQLLKEEHLLPFDRLAAVNGLTGCLAEQHKWEQTLSLAQTSIEAEPLQYMPYLVRFRIFQLNKQWEKALEMLHSYFKLLEKTSRASFDKAITREETLLQLSELALKANNRTQAAEFLDQLYRLKKGKVERDFLKKALVLAIELEDFERSVFFFKRLFQEQLPKRLGQEENEELNYFMNMFMNNGWYEYASDIYTPLVEQHPQDDLYKRRLIVALTKSQRIEEARALIAG